MEILGKSSGGNSPRSTLAARVSGSEPHLDEKSITSVFNSLRDRVYQRSFNLRKTFRELDAEGKGLVPVEVFAAEMTRFFSLSPLEQKCLRVLLEESDFRRDGKIDFREFCEMLKMRDYESDAVVSDSQRKRLTGPGVMDPRMQRMVRDGQQPIQVLGGVPTNELGHLKIECPFGVLGDSERMDAVIAAFLSHKSAQLKSVFAKHDSDRDGWLTRAEFRSAMKEIDRYVFDTEIDSLLDAILDNHGGAVVRRSHNPKVKQGNQVNIDAFVNGPGREYMKKKAHRSNAHANPFIWDERPAPPRTAGGSMRSPRAPNASASGKESPRSSSKRRVPETRASELRAEEVRAKIQELRKDDPYFALALEERAARLNTAGGLSTTPRLPAIASARR